MSQIHRVPEQIGSEIASAAIKSSPAVAVTAGAAAGMSLEDWVFVATLVYLVLQIGYLLWKWVRDIRRARREQASG